MRVAQAYGQSYIKLGKSWIPVLCVTHVSLPMCVEFEIFGAAFQVWPFGLCCLKCTKIVSKIVLPLLIIYLGEKIYKAA